ncbi:MAG: YcjX family protein, partial [Pseudomonadota bacterium]
MRERLRRIEQKARLAAATLEERLGELVEPSLRVGVTGLSRSGKTVFLAALVHNLIHGGRLPLFSPYAEGRLASA